MQPETRWRFFTDGVMGGVSIGQVAFVEEDGQGHARMTGRVSTANRGGFIQMRLDLASPPPAGTSGVRLVVRGNDQRCFVRPRDERREGQARTRPRAQTHRSGLNQPAPDWP